MRRIAAVVVLFLLCCAPVSCGPSDDTGKTLDAGPGKTHEKKREPNVLVVTMDTTRADHLRCYGNDDIQTPNIDQLAAEGVLFEEAFSVQPVTLPSHSSIFTGLYPYNHGVRDNNIYKLSDKVTTLAEILHSRGYLTTAFISSYILNRQFGLHQGFRYYNDRFVKPKQKGRLPVDRRAAEVSFLARDWLDEVSENLEETPFFLWLHYYDPHADYSPPHPYKTAYASQYDGEIAYTDDWLGYFFDELKKRGIWDDTIVVLTADHGESLGEYGEKTHGLFIYRPTTHVPLIIRYPGALPSGKRIGERVSTVDIMPTILGLLKIEAPENLDGRNLLPLVEGKPYPEDRDIYSEVFIPRTFNWSELKGVRSSDRFYVAAPRPELYELERGKREFGNLLETEPETAARMSARLEEILAGATPPETENVTVTEDMVERLEALGYFAGGGDAPLEASPDAGLPDPKDRVGLFNLHQRANGLSAAGHLEEAVHILEMMTQKDQGNSRFLMELGDLQCKLGKYREGIGSLDRAIAVEPSDSRLFFLQGKCYRDWGKGDRAARSLEESIRLSPKHFLALFNLGMIHIEAGRWTDAEKVFGEALKIHPMDAGVLNNLGYIAIKGRGAHEEGIALIEKAKRAAPENPFILGSLGSAYHGAGDNDKAARNLEAALKSIPDNIQFIEQLKEVYGEAGNVDGVAAMDHRLEVIRSR